MASAAQVLDRLGAVEASNADLRAGIQAIQAAVTTMQQELQQCSQFFPRMAALEAMTERMRQDLGRNMQSHEALHAEVRDNAHRKVNFMDAKLLIPETFDKEQAHGLTFREWSYNVKSYVENLNAPCKKAMDETEHDKAIVTAARVAEMMHLGYTQNADLHLKSLLIAKTKGHAKSIVRGADIHPALEMWRALNVYFDPDSINRSLDESRRILDPPKASSLEKLAEILQGWENLCQRHESRNPEERLPEGHRMSIMIKMLPDHEEREISATKHLWPRYEQLKAHIYNLIHDRTKGKAPMMMSLEDEYEEFVNDETGEIELFKIELKNGQRFRRKINPKGKGKGKEDRECYRCGKLGHIAVNCRSTKDAKGNPVTPQRPRRNAAGNVEEEPEAKALASTEKAEIEIGGLEDINHLEIAESEDRDDDAMFDWDELDKISLNAIDDEEEPWVGGEGASFADPWVREDPWSQSSGWRKKIEESKRPLLPGKWESLEVHLDEAGQTALGYMHLACQECINMGVYPDPRQESPEKPTNLYPKAWQPEKEIETPAQASPLGSWEQYWEKAKGNFGQKRSPPVGESAISTQVPTPGRKEPSEEDDQSPRRTLQMSPPPGLVCPESAPQRDDEGLMNKAKGARGLEGDSTSDCKASCCKMKWPSARRGRRQAASTPSEDPEAQETPEVLEWDWKKEGIEIGEVKEDQLIEIGAVDDEAIPEAEGMTRLARDITVDSGAGESVADPSDFALYPLEESKGSQCGQKYVGPSGETIANQGQKKVIIVTEDGAQKRVTFQAARVRKPLLAVSSACDKNQFVLFDNEGSYICRKDNDIAKRIMALIKQLPGKLALRRKNGVYTLPAWHAPQPASFPGRGREGL